MRFIALFAGLLLFACQSTPRVQPAFYYWKTQFRMDSTSFALLDRLSGTAPLYLRLFDVDMRADAAVPLGALKGTAAFDGRAFVPVVFITNRVFQQLSDAQVDSLADKVSRKILHYIDELALASLHHVQLATQGGGVDSLLFIQNWPRNNVPEIQIDCDWTKTTRVRYFRFLKQFKQTQTAQQRRLSCTIRLHQFRDRIGAGIPPVERGMLMCYNMAAPGDTTTRNAVFDLSLLRGYLSRAEPYPLPLDVGLPLFGWSAWFRDGTFKGLISELDAPVLKDSTRFVALGEGKYRLRRDTVLQYDYLREGDLFRLDAPSNDDLKASVAVLRNVVAPNGYLLFFDWDDARVQSNIPLIEAIEAGF